MHQERVRIFLKDVYFFQKTLRYMGKDPMLLIKNDNLGIPIGGIYRQFIEL